MGATFDQNTVYNLSSSGASASIYGIHAWVKAGASAAYNIVGNNIYNLSASGSTSPTIYGIYSNAQLFAHDIDSNNIHDFTTTTGAGSAKVYGIYSTGTASVTGTIYKNNIYNLSAGNSAGTATQVVGMYLPSASYTHNIYNNFLSSFSASSAANSDAVIGIHIATNGSISNLFYNTIRFSSLSGGANFGAYGVIFPAATGSSKLTLKNNIINVQTTGALSGNGYAVCLSKRGTTGSPSTNNYDGNYNILYSNPVATNYFYAEQTASAAVISNGYNLTIDGNFNACNSTFKSYMGSGNGRESSTYTEDNLSAGTTSGTWYPTSSSFAYQSGLQITSPAITSDFAYTTRNNPPCRGALEFTGTFPNSAGPVINYTALSTTSYCLTYAPGLSANITASAGIPNTAGTKPRMYYKGNTDADAYAGNTSSDNGWKWVETTSSSSPYSFRPDYTILNHSLSTGSVVSYFVVAQDNNSNVSYNSVGLANCPSSVALTSGAFPTQSAPVPNSYTITAVPTFTTSVGTTSMCGVGNPILLSVAPTSGDLALQWEQSTNGGGAWSDISGATSNYNNATPPTFGSGVTSNAVLYNTKMYCNATLTATSTNATSTEYNPGINSVTNGSRCGTGSVTLSANGTLGSKINWYNAATGGVPLATTAVDGSGNASWTTPSISSTTTYYVADSFGSYGNPQILGPSSPTGSSAYSFSIGYNAYGYNFTTTVPLTLSSVDIYPYNTGTLYNYTLGIYDNVGNLIYTSATQTPSGNTGSPSVVNTVPINFYLAPGNYQIAFKTQTNALALWSLLNATFPYQDTFNTMQITGQPVTGVSYFYNWKVVAGCTVPYGYGTSGIATRTPVTATINSLPTAGTASGSPSTVCVGSSITLAETGSPVGSGTMVSYAWTGPGSYSSSALGSSVASTLVSASSTVAAGYYSLTVTYPGTGCTSTPVATNYVTVNSATTPVISGTLSACAAGTRTLAADIPSGTWSTADATIASVDAALGIVTAVAAGTVNINYTSPCGTVGTAVFTVNTTPGTIAGVTDLCVNNVTTLTNPVGGGTWSSSNLFVATVNSASGAVYSGASSGSTTISYSIANATGSCATGITFHVNTNFPSPITGASSVCVNGITTLSDPTAGGTWTTDDPTYATVSTGGGVTGVAAGTVNINYSTGCGSPVVWPITVNGSSIAIANNGPLCHGSTLALTASVGAGTYSWIGPNGFSSALQNPSISNVATAASGNYSFSATVAGCTNSAKMFVVVDSLPSANVTATPSAICTGGTSVLSDAVTSPTVFTTYAIPYSLTALTSPTTLNSGSSWTGGNGDGYINVGMPFTFTLFGVNYSSVNISANGYVNFGTGFSSGGYTPFTLPSTNAAVPRSMIALFWHDMKVTSGTITYGTMGVAPNRKFIINYNAIPDVSGGQTNTGQIVLYETSNNIDLMVSNTAASTKTCGVQNSTGTLAQTATAENNTSYAITSAAPQGWRFATPSYNYTWSPAASLTSSVVANPSSIGLTSSQTFTVNTVDQYSSCSGLASNVAVTVNPIPTVGSISSSSSALCSGGSITLTAGAVSGGAGSFVSYVWSGPGGYSNTVSSIGINTVAASPTVTGVYSVYANYSIAGCSGVAPGISTTINVAAQPAVTSVTPSAPAICYGSSVTLASVNTGGIGTPSYTWSGPAITTTTSAGGTSPVFTPTVIGTSAYSITIGYTGTGCNNAVGSANVTLNPVPSITFLGMPSICASTGVTLTNIPYGSGTGSPTLFNMSWDAAALSASFGNVTGGTLPSPSAGNVSLTIPATAPDAIYTGTLTVANSNCVSTGYATTLTVYAYPTAAITSAAAPCMGDATSVVFTGTPGADVRYSVDAGGATNSIMAGGTYTLTTGVFTVPHTYHLINAHNAACTNSSVAADQTINPIPQKWVGGTVSFLHDWNTVTNWTCGRAPLVTDDVTIDGTYTYAPEIAVSSVGTTRDLTIAPGAQILINADGVLNVKGNVTSKGAVTGSGKLVLNGTTPRQHRRYQ